MINTFKKYFPMHEPFLKGEMCTKTTFVPSQSLPSTWPHYSHTELPVNIHLLISHS